MRGVNRMSGGGRLCLALATMLVLPAIGDATPPSSGQVSIAFKSPPELTGTWQFDITVFSLIAFNQGEFHFDILADTIGARRNTTIIWKGGMGQGDTLRLSHQILALPEGAYSVYAYLLPYPGRAGGGRGSASYLYVLVTEKGVFYSGSASGAKYEEIQWELRQRGLDGISREAMDTLASDLAERIRELSISRRSPRADSLSGELRKQWGLPPRDTLPKPRDMGVLQSGAMIQLSDRPVRVKPAPEPKPEGPVWKEPYTPEGGPPPLRERPPALSGPTRKPGDSDFARSAEAAEMRAAWREMQKSDTTLPDLPEPEPPPR